VLTKQFATQVCEVELVNDDEFISFFEKNYGLFCNHLLSIKGEISARVESFLKQKGYKYIQNVELPKGKLKESLEKEVERVRQEAFLERQELEAKLAKLSNKLQQNLKVMDSLVRSGQELKVDGDLLLLNRVNSGATINVSGSLIITQIVEGSIRCNGDFMMLKASPKANIVFHGVEVDNDYLKDRLNRVELIENKIHITPVLKETNWA